MSLELKGRVHATVRHYESRSDSKNDGKTARVKLDVRLDEVEAKELGGKLFADTCFSDYVGKSGAIVASQKKLAGELEIKAEHTLKIEDYPVSTKPKITGVELADEGERAVTLSIKLEIPFTSAKLRRLLDDANGDRVDVVFEGVTQPELPGGDNE